METKKRELRDLVSLGPAMLRDLDLLGISTVAQLSKKHPQQMYRQLSELKRQSQDICCLDVFTAAVAQAKNARLPIEQCQWWYWSRRRKTVTSNGERIRKRRESLSPPMLLTESNRERQETKRED